MGSLLAYIYSSKTNTSTNAEQYYQNVISNQISGNNPKEQIQLTMTLTECNSTYPYLITVLMSDESNMYRVIGKTNDQYADSKGVIIFNITFVMDYFFEKQQNLQINVGKNNKTYSLKTTIGSIMGSRQHRITKPISTNDYYNPEKLTINANTPKNNNMNVGISIAAEFQKNNQIFYIIKKVEGLGKDKYGINVYKSEVAQVINGKVNFNHVKLPSNVLCNGEFDNLIMIEFHDFTYQSQIGQYETSVNRLLSKEFNFVIQSIDSYHELKANVKCNLIKEYTFLDYIRGGLQIALTIGIDFTASNGSPSSYTSLHHIGSDSHNNYEKAIRSCGDIVAYYDYDQLFPVYGYGALLRGNGNVSHCFPINLNHNDPNIFTIDGVLTAYKNIFQTISLSGPTYFAPLINRFINDVKSINNNMVYNILMILTDGMINDMDKTIDALVEASFMPVSVIIVGIGKNDFGNMDILDADENPLYDKNGRKAVRDLVQFVPFYKFENDGNKLAEQVLEEVPRQLLEYYSIIRMPPGDPLTYA
jgi:hypothetical protein